MAKKAKKNIAPIPKKKTRRPEVDVKIDRKTLESTLRLLVKRQNELTEELKNLQKMVKFLTNELKKARN